MRPINFLTSSLRQTNATQQPSSQTHTGYQSHPLLPNRQPPLIERFSVNQLTVMKWHLGNALNGYREMQVPGIGLSMDRMKQHGLEGAIEEVNRSGLKVSTLGWVGGFTGHNGYSWDDAVRDARLAIWAAGQVGAQAVNVMSGPLHQHIGTHARRIVFQALEELAPVAQANNVRLALHPLHPVYAQNWTFLHTLDEAIDIVFKVNHPSVGIGFGPYHVWGEERLCDRLHEIAPLIATVQLCDWHHSPQDDHDRALPGDGCIPFPQIIATLEAAGYKGMYEIDVWSREAWKRDHYSLLSDCRRRYESLCRW